MAQRQLKLGAFMRPVSIHTGAWRYPGAVPDANFNFPLMKQMIRKLEAGRVSHLRRDVTSLSEAFVEGKRLNLLMETYGGHHVDLAPLSVAANRFLESVGVQSESQIDALYQVRNFVFHQGRNVLDSHAKLLSEVANEFAVVVPDLLARFQFPIRDYGMSAALSELNVEYAALATDETFLP